MGKFYGKIGFAVQKEITPGYWDEEITERPYYGDLIRNRRKLQVSGQVNDNVNVSNEISIVADPFAVDHFYNMRYVDFMGARWKISDFEVQYPRLILTIGDLYHG